MGWSTDRRLIESHVRYTNYFLVHWQLHWYKIMRYVPLTFCDILCQAPNPKYLFNLNLTVLEYEIHYISSCDIICSNITIWDFHIHDEAKTIITTGLLHFIHPLICCLLAASGRLKKSLSLQVLSCTSGGRSLRNIKNKLTSVYHKRSGQTF